MRTRYISPAVMLLLVVGLLSSRALAATAEDGTLTIATYNVENFFDVYDNPYTQDEVTRVKPHQDIAAVVSALRAIDADVVAVTEIENEHVLHAIAREYLADLGYRYVVAGQSNDGRGIRVGVLSRLPIRKVVSYRLRDLTLPNAPGRWRFARDLTQVTIEVNETRELHLLAVHYKSKRDSTGDPNSARWRLAEAIETRKVVDELFVDAGPNAWVAVVGDFNDTPESSPLVAVQGDATSPSHLLDVHRNLPASERITYLREPYRSTIDYILVSRAMAARLVAGSARVLGEDESLAGSDHAPVLASFDISE